MKLPVVYMSAAITGNTDSSVIRVLVEGMEGVCEVVCEHVAYVGPGGGAPGIKAGDAEAIWRYDMGLLDRADMMVAEVSARSHGVGYEIRRAVERGIPVLCLVQQETTFSAMVAGDPAVEVQRYEDAQHALELAREWIGRVTSS